MRILVDDCLQTASHEVLYNPPPVGLFAIEAAHESDHLRNVEETAESPRYLSSGIAQSRLRERVVTTTDSCKSSKSNDAGSAERHLGERQGEIGWLRAEPR